jgi:hypothetical protein
MTILHDDGLYRHLRFAEPGTGMYHFDLVTWPGRLTIVGDMPPEALVFSRLDDMFQFFRGAGDINPGYWAEKLRSGRGAAEKYSMDLFRQIVAERVADAVEADEDLGPVDDDRPGLAAAVEAALTDDYDYEHEEGAREFLIDFVYRYTDAAGAARSFKFTDTWEWDFAEYDWAYLWACHAIRWGVAQYDAAKGALSVAGAEEPQQPAATEPRVKTLQTVGDVL